MRRLAGIVAYRVAAYAGPALVSSAVAAYAIAASAQAAPLHLQDRAFMTYAIEQDLAQVDLSQLAMEKAADPEVKRFAASTLAYHRESVNRLQAAAQRLEIKPPAALNPVAQRTRATLEGLSGTAFDRAYLTSMVIANMNGMYSARREAKHGFDRGLRAEGARQDQELLANRRSAERIARRLKPGAAPAEGLSAEDRNFLLYAMHIDMAQKGFAEIAAERATNPRVRTFARDLVSYHTRSYERLAQLATAKGLEPLREVSGISKGTQDRMRAMKDGSGLDRTYLNAHAFTSYGAHYRYEREAIHGSDAQVRAIAEEDARIARRHHWRALRIINGEDAAG